MEAEAALTEVVNAPLDAAIDPLAVSTPVTVRVLGKVYAPAPNVPDVIALAACVCELAALLSSDVCRLVTALIGMLVSDAPEPENAPENVVAFTVVAPTVPVTVKPLWNVYVPDWNVPGETLLAPTADGPERLPAVTVPVTVRFPVTVLLPVIAAPPVLTVTAPPRLTVLVVVSAPVIVVLPVMSAPPLDTVSRPPKRAVLEPVTVPVTLVLPVIVAPPAVTVIPLPNVAALEKVGDVVNVQLPVAVAAKSTKAADVLTLVRIAEKFALNSALLIFVLAVNVVRAGMFGI